MWRCGDDGCGKRQQAVRAMRGQMRSPGRPPAGAARGPGAVLGGDRRGVSSEDAAAEAGVSPAVGYAMVPAGWRDAADHVWPRCRDGTCRSLSGRRSRSCARSGCGVREIARRLGRSPSTISRELRRNASTRSVRGWTYRATTAQWHADRRASRPKVAKLAANERAARVRAGPARRRDHPAGRRGRCRARSALDRPSARPPRGPTLGEVVEPGADLEPAAGRLPR